MLIRDLTSDDLPAAWSINQANVPAVGDVTLDKLAWITSMSSIALAAVDAAQPDELLGFCLVVPPGTEYTSVNYAWFGERYDAFAYLDRVAVAEQARNQGIGSALYAEVERRAAGHGLFTLEVNLRPRNDGSLRFHHRLGFAEVGQLETDYGVLVSLLAKPL